MWTSLFAIGSLLGTSLRPPSTCDASPRTAHPAMVISRGKQVDPNDRVVFVDGNNLMMQRKVTKGRHALAAKLSGLKNGEVFLVFDGKKGEPFRIDADSDPQMVVTCGGTEETGEGRMSADDWILEQIPLVEAATVEVVTADKLLRKGAQICNAKTINPVKFWRRYLPRLKGLKSDYSNKQKEE